MKLLQTTPPIPPYLHLGSAWLSMSSLSDRPKELHRLIDDKWRQLSAEVIRNRQNVREITRRIDERSADPEYTEATYEVFYTITEEQRGLTLVNYYF